MKRVTVVYNNPLANTDTIVFEGSVLSVAYSDNGLLIIKDGDDTIAVFNVNQWKWWKGK